uniref:Reverse transcriptase domain-containing protein n=1 Tax=Salarias fasciatus TaxID=181472 RepID=A0A672F6E3_SALFA
MIDIQSADSGRYTVMVIEDLSSAFDTVDHQILINRLQDLIGQSGPVLQWFSSYLAGRNFSVSVNLRSEPANLQCGVPQGLVLVLFRDVSFHLFVDNLQLYCSFKPSESQKLSSLINCLSLSTQ